MVRCAGDLPLAKIEELQLTLQITVCDCTGELYFGGESVFWFAVLSGDASGGAVTLRLNFVECFEVDSDGNGDTRIQMSRLPYI